MPTSEPGHSFKALGLIFFLFFFARISFASNSSDALIAKLDCPDPVNAVDFSPDGRLLAAGYGRNGRGGVRIWNTADRSVVPAWVEQNTENGNENVDKVVFSPDGRLLAAATSAGDVLVWNIGTWGEPKRIILKAGSPTALVFSPNSGMLALSSESAVFVFDMKTLSPRKVSSEEGPAQKFIVAGFSADSMKLAVCRYAAVEWWDASTGNTERGWGSYGLGFFCSLSSDHNYMVTGGGPVYGDKNVELLNASNGKSLGRQSNFRSGLFTSAISHSDQWIALGGGNYGPGGDLSLWSFKDFHEAGFVSEGKFPIAGLAFSPDDSVLAAGSEDGAVLLLAVDRLRGPMRTKQTHTLCGEVSTEKGKVFIMPLAKVPGMMGGGFSYAWQLEVANPGKLVGFAGLPVAFEAWDVESNAADDKARVNKFIPLSPKLAIPKMQTEYAVFGDVQNPGWDGGFVVKVYENGSFVAASNSGECLAYGSLNSTGTPNFGVLKRRLLAEGILSVPRNPLTRGLDHERTRFIELFSDDGLQIRTDAEVVDFSHPRTQPSKKEEDFARIFNQEEPFVSSLLHAGMQPGP